MKNDNLYHEFHDSTPAQRAVPIGVADTPFVDKNTARIALVITAPGANPAFIAWNGPASATNGIRIPAGGNPLVLTAALHGALVFGPITASVPLGAETMTFAESTSNCPCARG